MFSENDMTHCKVHFTSLRWKNKQTKTQTTIKKNTCSTKDYKANIVMKLETETNVYALLV